MPDVGQIVVSCASAGRELNNLFTTGACWETAGGSASETKQMSGIRRASFFSTTHVLLLLLPLFIGPGSKKESVRRRKAVIDK